jgi:hypothetical protein
MLPMSTQGARWVAPLGAAAPLAGQFQPPAGNKELPIDASF